MIRRGFQALSKVLKLEPQRILKGTDLYGNRYYEVPPQKYFLYQREVVKLKRTVEPPEMKKYIRGGLEAGKNVPTEWMTWLQWRRDDPPTHEEVENNLIRIQQMAEKVRLLDQKYSAEKKKTEASQTPTQNLEKSADVEGWTPK